MRRRSARRAERDPAASRHGGVALTRSLEDLASPYLSGLIPYSPGKPIEEVEREFGISGSVKLASNENPLGPSPKALQAIAGALPNLHRYPDGGGYALRQALSRHWDVPADWLILGNGSNELLEMVGRSFLMPGDEVLYARQAFIVYDMVAQVTGATKVAVPLAELRPRSARHAGGDHAQDEAGVPGQPEQPHRNLRGPPGAGAFLGAVPPDVIVVLDEAYYEYLPPEARPDALRFVRDGRRVLVLRTFSKIYGLAGLRIGYGIGPAPLVTLLNRVREPFQHQQPGAGCGGGSARRCGPRRGQSRGQRGRPGLPDRSSAGPWGWPSFRAWQTSSWWTPGVRGGRWRTRCSGTGVIVRPVAGYGFATHLRITIGTAQENEKCVGALRAVLGK